MEGRNSGPQRSSGTKGKSPAERSEEFDATQKRLKEEAAARRAEAQATKDDAKQD